MKAAFALLLLLALSSAFSIEDYEGHVSVNSDGSLLIYEKITFYLDQQYNEGYRSIRAEDFGALSDIRLNEVKVNGKKVSAATQLYEGQAEIVWEETFIGENVVELNYSIRDRIEIYNDFAKVCFEHYGANWPVAAKKFTARTTLPIASGNKTMHFEVYSTKQGKAYVDDLTIVIELDDVPSGNYVGGCYLFDRGSVASGNIVDDTAYDKLKEERELYGSLTVLEAQRPNLEFCCLPVFAISAIVAALVYMKDRGRPRLPESILPPGKEEPAVVSALVRNKVETKEMLAATVVDLINKGVIDIVELEKEDARPDNGISRERTVLFLKKMPTGLKKHERTVLDFIFADGKEVDLDAKIEEFKKVPSQSKAKGFKVVTALESFNSKFPSRVDDLFEDAEIRALKDGASNRLGSAAAIIFLGGFGLLIMLSAIDFGISSDSIGWYVQHGEWLLLGAIIVSAFGCVVAAIYSLRTFLKPAVPKKPKNRELYARWDAFYRGLQASRIKEYPPSSALIWGRIIVYATALGLADKVRKHLSELDSVVAAKVRRMDGVALSSMSYYAGAMSVRNLATTGNRAGIKSSGGAHGGFSSYSSGGWSSGGGGGFSGGSSGGGGFR